MAEMFQGYIISDEIIGFIRNSSHISAIKQCRIEHNLGLYDAKQLMDAYREAHFPGCISRTSYDVINQQRQKQPTPIPHNIG